MRVLQCQRTTHPTACVNAMVTESGGGQVGSACTSTVSQRFMFLWSILANFRTTSLLIILCRSGLFLLPCSQRLRVALCYSF